MINILFCGNDKFFDGVLTTSLSIFKRTTTTEPFHIFIYTMDVSYLNPNYKAVTDEQVEFLQKVAKKYNSESIVTKVDVGELYQREFSGCPNEGAYCSPYTLLRLLADLIPKTPNKLLYLDCDLMFNRDITLLYKQDIKGYEYAAARDHYGKFTIHPNYINAGVLLFNMQEMRKTKLLEKARDWIKTKKLMFADQSAIYRSTIRKKMLPVKFNDQKFLHKNTVVRHFSKRLFWFPYPHTANIKQWKIDEVHKIFKYKVFDDIYDEYLTLKEEFESEHKQKHPTKHAKAMKEEIKTKSQYGDNTTKHLVKEKE